MRIPLKTLIMSGLTVLTAALAAAMAGTGRATWLEGVSFVTGAVCVWLTVRENIWNFPIGLLNVATFCFVFYEARLYADAGLQVVYFVLGVVGWYLWLRGGERRTALHIVRASVTEIVLLLCSIGILTLVLWQILSHVGGSSSFWDALTTAISLAAQWLLNRKRLENWVTWIVADMIYVPLYLSKGLYLTSILYAVFLAMAVMGLCEWASRWRKELAERESALIGSNL